MFVNVDLFIIAESRFDHSVLPSELIVEGYSNPFRCDQNRSAGGL